MSIIHAAVKLIIREHARYKFKGPVVCLGVPEIYATADELASWFPEYTGAPSLLKQSEVQVSTNKYGRQLNWVTAESFFRAFGFDGYDSLDIPGSEHRAAIQHDLNQALPSELKGKYKLLLDPGTLEHVFDQKACMKTVVQALAVDGVAVHFVPIYSFNGGYYSINPNVLNDFYQANGFDDIRSYILMWDRYRWFSAVKTRCYEYRKDVLGSRHALADYDQVRYTPHLLLFARKRREVDEIVVPLQFGGDYVGEATAPSESRAQSLESFGKRWALRLQRFLPLGLSVYLQSAIYRRLVLWRARRVAGFWI